MKQFFIFLFVVSHLSYSHAKQTPISVVQFQDKTASSSCRFGDDWWFRNLGDSFQAVTQQELIRFNNLEVLEREGIDAIYEDEVNLVNSEDDTSIRKAQFKKAKYTLVGTVTKYEFCADSKGGSVNVGVIAGLLGVSVPDIDLGRRVVSASVEVQIRLIDVESGRIVKSVVGQGEAKSSQFDISAFIGSYESAKNSPVGDAIEAAIGSAVDKLSLGQL